MTTNDTNSDPTRLDDRANLGGDVDFTMMYVAHDAFSRDLERLVTACRDGNAWEAAEHARWANFNTQLHIHHRGEDDALWPPLRSMALQAADVVTLDAMELEHAQMDPLLEQVAGDIAADHPAALAVSLQRLRDVLAAHMRHEENAALPLIERHLGPSGWRAFTSTFRETQGIRGAAVYFPWLLEGAPEDVKARVLGVLPPPARLLYRAVWAPRFRRSYK